MPAIDFFAADNFRKPDNSIGDQVWMLNKVGGVTDHARNQKLVVGQLRLFPYLPLVFVAHIAHLY